MTQDEVFNQVKAMAPFANKEVGQHFLVDQAIAEKIVKLLDSQESDNVFEIGSGFGSLSIFLMKEKYKTLTFNDIDPRAIDFLDNLVKDQKRTYVVNKSAIKANLSIYSKVIGNLPYYITSDLLETCFAKNDADKYVFMVQKEVEPRLIPKINNENYGPLAIIMDYIGEYHKEFVVPRNAFLPVPRVDSLVFSIINKHRNDIDKQQYLLFLKKMFIHRRKTIYNNLSLYLMDKNKANDILAKLKISILTRPEQIEPKTYLDIFKLTK